MKKIFKLVYVLSIFAAFTACDDYLDVNKNPNNPAVADLTPDDMISGAQTTTANTLNGTMNQLGNIMVASWSANATDFASPFDDEFRYDVTSNFYTGIWTSLYNRTANFTHIENYEDGQNWDNHKAVAKILKAFYFQYIVDMYGDSPYSEAHLANANLFPAYDDDQATYVKLNTLLDEAIALIANADQVTVKPFTGTDVIMGGDMARWTAFAYTVKLRLLMRQSTLAQTDATLNTYITDEFTAMQNAGATFITEDVTINPGYLNSDGKQNPFFAAFGLDPAGNETSTHRMVGPSEHSFDFLDGSGDPRLERLWKPRADGTFQGIEQGASSGRTAQLGPGKISSSVQDSFIMLAAESFFLQAEAVERGYIAGTAQDLFNSGIAASFLHLGAGSSAGYIAATSNHPNLGWNGSGGHYEAIATQKWVALTSTNGAELWMEYNRTSFPLNLPLSSVTTQVSRPNRLLYPDTEYTGNSNNVISQVAQDAFDTKVFWDN